jgi:hypothetical protein
VVTRKQFAVATLAVALSACGLGVPKSAVTGIAKVKLGGDVTIVRSCGELVTAIINPSHKIAAATDPAQVAPEGQSLMERAALNDRMTVRQLTDLVAFLQTTYKVVPPPYYPYTRVYP